MTRHVETSNLSLFCDFENIALGVRDAQYAQFDINPILERLLVKGSIVVKKAYCDWERYKTFKRGMHEAAFELIDIPHVRQSGKNSADIRMVVDALDLCYTKSHVDTFVIISGDSDFSPLVSKLRENAKTVIGVGVKNSTSDLLINNCDEFIYYDDLVREIERKKPARRKKKKASRAGQTDAAASDAVSAAELEGKQDGEGKSAEDAGDGGEKGKRKRRGDKPAATTKQSAADTELPEELAELDDGADDESGDDDLAQEGLDIVVDTALALNTDRGDGDKLWGSMIKQTLKRRRPGFNESYYGFESFGKMLEEAEARGMLKLELDDRSGGYIIRSIT